MHLKEFKYKVTNASYKTERFFPVVAPKLIFPNPVSSHMSPCRSLVSNCRCEASIAKLSGDISIIRHEVQKIDKEICSLHSTLKYSVSGFEKMVSAEAHGEIPEEW